MFVRATYTEKCFYRQELDKNQLLYSPIFFIFLLKIAENRFEKNIMNNPDPTRTYKTNPAFLCPR